MKKLKVVVRNFGKNKDIKKQKTITIEELKRLQFCNSKKLPQKVNHDGIVKEWVGIGWIDTREVPTRDIPKII
jgi:hypothetical protein